MSARRGRQGEGRGHSQAGGGGRAVCAAGIGLSDSRFKSQRRAGRPAIRPTSLAPELQKAIAGLKPGDVTEVIRTSRGFQLIRIETLDPGTIKSFEDSRNDIADRIAGEKRRGEIRSSSSGFAGRRSSTGRTTR